MKKLVILILLCITQTIVIMSMEQNDDCEYQFVKKISNEYELVENAHTVVCDFIDFGHDKQGDHNQLSTYLNTNPNFNLTFERLHNTTRKESDSNPKFQESLLTFAIHNGYCPKCVDIIVSHPNFQLNEDKNEIHAALWQRFQQEHLISIESIETLKNKYDRTNPNHKKKLDDAITQYMENKISSTQSILNDFTKTETIEIFAKKAAQKAFEQLENPNTADKKRYFNSDEITDLFKISK